MKKVMLTGIILAISMFFVGCFGEKPAPKVVKITKIEAKDMFASFFPKDVADVEISGEDLKVILKNKIFFDSGKSQVKDGAKESLNKVIEIYTNKILPAYPDSKIIVEGHADSDGSEKFNMKISQERALSVVSYLSSPSLGVYIDESKLTAIGYGEDMPRVANTSEENKAMNRRVELIFKGIKN